jgi:hypothetical protein
MSRPDPLTVAAVLARLEEISRSRPDRVLRLRGRLPLDGAEEHFELLIFRGFSSSTTHPTDVDPDQPALPPEALLESGELLAGPLNPQAERRLGAPAPVEHWLHPAAW